MARSNKDTLKLIAAEGKDIHNMNLRKIRDILSIQPLNQIELFIK